MSSDHRTQDTHRSHHTSHHTAGTHKAAHAEHAAKSEIPKLNINELLERFRFPGVDFAALAEAQRKNMQALQEANEKAYTGALALAQRQAKIFEETMTQWQKAAKELIGKTPSESLAIQADLARKAIESALSHMRELAEMAAKSQSEAFEVIAKRVRAGIEEFREQLKKKPH